MNLLGEELSFTLDNGYTAIIGPEERRVYNRIINSNVGVITTIGLDGEHWIHDEACRLVLTAAWT